MKEEILPVLMCSLNIFIIVIKNVSRVSSCRTFTCIYIYIHVATLRRKWESKYDKENNSSKKMNPLICGLVDWTLEHLFTHFALHVEKYLLLKIVYFNYAFLFLMLYLKWINHVYFWKYFFLFFSSWKSNFSNTPNKAGIMISSRCK